MRSTCYSTICVFILSVSLCVVNCESGTEIILNETTTLFFPGSQINSFYGCLCNNFSNTCTVSYEKDGDDYKIMGTNQTVKYEIEDPLSFHYNKSVQCRVSKQNLMSSDEFHCVRQFGKIPCDNSSLCKVCDVGYITIIWVDGKEAFVVRQRDDVTDPPSKNHVTQNPDVSNSNNVSNNNDVNNTEDLSKNKDDDIPLIAGLACGAVVIILIILIVFIVCRRQRQKSKTPNNKTKTVISPSCNPSRDKTNSLARPRDRTSSNYDQCEIETSCLESSRKPIENRRTTNTLRDDYDYSTVDSDNVNRHIKDLDDYTTVWNSYEDTQENITTKVKLHSKANNNDDYSIVDTTYSQVSDNKVEPSSTPSSKKDLSENVEHENVEYAFVDKSKKTNPKKKPYVNTENDASKEPNSSDFAIMEDDNHQKSEDCQYAEVKKPKPNPKNIYSHLGEHVRDMKNPYSVV